MSRFDDCDDGEEFAGQFALQEANEYRSLRGKRGQASLRALEAALVALPVKRLIDGAFVDTRGEVCALGALAQHLGKPLPKPVPEGEDDEDYFYNTTRIAKACGMPLPVALKVAWTNDRSFGQVWSSDLSPEMRYERMLEWVRQHLRAESK